MMNNTYYLYYNYPNYSKEQPAHNFMKLPAFNTTKTTKSHKIPPIPKSK